VKRNVLEILLAAMLGIEFVEWRKSLFDKACCAKFVGPNTTAKSLSAAGIRDYWPTAAGISRVDVL
jgi:hypothetical protein